MASSLAKECLSPALKGGSSMRRRSLDLCQQLGSQFLSSNLIHQISPSLNINSPSKSASPNGSNNGLSSPFRLIEENKKLLSSPVFSFVGNNEAPGSSCTTYHNKRRASDSFWMVDGVKKLTAFDFAGGRGQEKIQKRRQSITPQHPTSYNSFSRHDGESHKETCSESESTDADTETSDESKQAEHCACIIDTVTAAERVVNSGGRQSSVITCNIIPPTPLKQVGAICKGNCKKEQLSTMPPLQCSLAFDDEIEGCSEDNFEAVDTIFSRNQQSVSRKRTQTFSFPLAKEFSPTELLRRCSAGAKYDLDEKLIKLVSRHRNLSLNPNELLGKGNFGTVIAGQYQGKQVAVKVLKTTNTQRKASILGENNALNLPFHNHIAHTMDIFQLGPDRALIIMDKHMGNLLTLLNDPLIHINCSKAINISKQIALALIFCHRQGILHLDVKPQNVLVDFRNCCKLSDFGSSKKISDVDGSYEYYKLEGTVPYTAPELFKGARPTERCDVYSLAITMWQIITREIPYEDENEHTVIFRVVSQGLRPGNNNDPSTSSSTLNEKKLEIEYVKLYKQAWDSVPEMRPSMVDIHKSLIKIQFLQ